MLPARLGPGQRREGCPGHPRSSRARRDRKGSSGMCCSGRCSWSTF